MTHAACPHPADERIRVCAVCHSPEVGERGYGDESWTICDDCASVEQGYADWCAQCDALVSP